MIVLIDNYDSFVHNLARYFRRLGQETRVVRNDATDSRRVLKLRPDAVVLSPGPCGPNEAGCCLEIVRELHPRVPMLGICLGHQVLAQAFGGKVVRGEPVHGRASLMTHDARGVFDGLPNPLRVGRYHSLVVDPLQIPSCLRVTARLEQGTVMALEHAELPVFGWQFHPESVLTEQGYRLLHAFLNAAGIQTVPLTSSHQDFTESMRFETDWFERAIEFP
jgi:anthranilate synthase/aminodeoxychorismate synthase-like glutamine amidotransferase